jgi:predicted SpoU family rRNA methylase
MINHREGNSEEVFKKAFSKLICNFKEANKKLIIVLGSEKLRKTYTESTDSNG